ncbi:nitrilase-related carbon-nitrogen hydrolase [Effusibacillus consociatus]|uniref:Nitrilase-related carbon-nitrogen hydrolase n=1 Tax=Effusibacillus consociatus TaxID=1117041 RepID=A0ABV9PXT9_9BACL
MAESRKPFVAACIQFNPKLNERDQNVKNLIHAVTEAAKSGAKLIVTPEMATTGYFYRDREAIQPFVDTIPGVTTNDFEKIAKQYGTYIVIGMPEADEETGIYYNSAALIGPEGYIGKYRKIHQWETEEHWAAWGDLEIPVFNTEVGKIAINICMDSVYFESARLAAIKGADILVFLTNSTAQTISTLQARAETNGLYVVSANRSNTENGFHMVGASAVWSPYGEKLAEAVYIASPDEDLDEPTIVYAEIDPFKFKNEAKKRLNERRPELYKDLMLYIAPWDFTKNTESHDITAAAIQYEPVTGNKEANLVKIKNLISNAVEKTRFDNGKLDLVVLPELSLTGCTDNLSKTKIYELAETINGRYVKELIKVAVEFGLHLVFGFIEKENNHFYNSAGLVTPEGEIQGVYRKTHLNISDKIWAAPGTKIPVFSAKKLGKIGIMIGYDAAFPEVAGVMAVNRADLIVVPSSWHGEYGRDLEINQTISVNRYPDGAMSTWDVIALGAQAYTIVSNFIGTEKNFLGRSALYTLDPLYGLDQPVVASNNREEALIARFSTIQRDWWFNQEKLILSRRTFFYKPLVI